MSEKYHISPETGNPNKCTAKPGNCRFGSDEKHYGTKEEARKAFEESHKADSALSGHKSKKISRKDKISANISKLEDLYLKSDKKLPWLEASYDKRYSQMLDVAISTVAKHSPAALLHEILEAEEIDPTRWGSYDADLAHTISEVHALWNYRGKIKSRPDNLMNPAEDNASWKDRFNRDVANLVVSRGSLMRFNESFYGWEEYDNTEKGSHVVAAFNLQEDHWTEFAGTFATQEDSRTGFSLEVMYSNGKFRKMRYEADLGSIMRELE